MSVVTQEKYIHFQKALVAWHLRRCLLYLFPRAALTKHHQRGGLKPQEVVVSQF